MVQTKDDIAQAIFVHRRWARISGRHQNKNDEYE